MATNRLERPILSWNFWIFNSRVILRRPRLSISNLHREKARMTKKPESILMNLEVAGYCPICFRHHSPSQTWTRLPQFASSLISRSPTIASNLSYFGSKLFRPKFSQHFRLFKVRNCMYFKKYRLDQPIIGPMLPPLLRKHKWLRISWSQLRSSVPNMMFSRKQTSPVKRRSYAQR